MRRRRSARRLRVPAGLVVPLVSLVCAASACSSGGSGNDPAVSRLVKVTAAEDVWGQIAAQIGGSHVRVTSVITDPGADPHTYASTPTTALALGRADLVIANGAGYDDFVGKVLASDPQPHRRVLTVAAVLGQSGAGDPNPHFWYWTQRLPAVASAIARQLAALDPRDAASFRSGAQRFSASLRPLLATVRQIRRRFAGAPVAYTERLPGYLLGQAGLRVVTPPAFAAALEDGTDPSPKDAAAFDADLTRHRVKVLIYNSQVVDAAAEHARSLAKSAGVPVVGMSELLPTPSTRFQTWQLSQDRALLASLTGR